MTFIVEGQFLAFGRDGRIAGLRAYPQGAEVARGEQLGTISDDIGGVAVCDIDPIAQWSAENKDAWHEWADEVLNDWLMLDPAGVIPCEPAKTVVIYADGGFGDATYPVYALRNGGGVLGLECEFLPVDVMYPFEPQSE